MADLPEGLENGIAYLASLDEHVSLEIIRTFLVDRPALLQELCDWAVPEHAFPSSKVVEARHEGQVKSFRRETGYGFISSPELLQAYGKDIFLSSHQIEGRGHSLDSFRTGTMVSFSIFLNKGKMQAYDLCPMAETSSPAQPRVVNDAAGYSQPLSSGYGRGAWGADHDWGTGYEAAAAPSQDGQYAGLVKSYNAEKRYGFLVCDELQDMIGKADIFVHGSQLEYVTNFEPGQVYRFTLAEDPKGNPMAANLRLQGRQADVAHQSWQTRSAMPAMASAPPPEMSYSAHPEFTGKRFVAPVKSYNPTKGFGFLYCEELALTFGKADIFVHHSQVGSLKNLTSFREGQIFSFTVVVDTHGKPMAVELRQESGTGAKRQRFA